MPQKIGIELVGFDGSVSQKVQRLPPFPLEDLLASAITVGKPDGAFYSTYRYSNILEHYIDICDKESYYPYLLYEAEHRLNLMLSIIDFESDDEFLKLSPLFHALDPSEKGACSYFLGMSFANLAAEKILDIRWLIHFSYVKDTFLGILPRSSRSMADLFGIEPLTVLEAKGRSNCSNSQLEDLKSKAKSQVINTLNNCQNVDFSKAIVSIFYPERNTYHLNLYWENILIKSQAHPSKEILLLNILDEKHNEESLGKQTSESLMCSLKVHLYHFYEYYFIAYALSKAQKKFELSRFKIGDNIVPFYEGILELGEGLYKQESFVNKSALLEKIKALRNINKNKNGGIGIGILDFPLPWEDIELKFDLV